MAFHAKARPSEVEVSGESTVTLKFPVTLTNEGQAYNSATGKATAPVGGVYLFLASVATSGHESAKVGLINKVRCEADAGQVLIFLFFFNYLVCT